MLQHVDFKKIDEQIFEVSMLLTGLFSQDAVNIVCDAAGIDREYYAEWMPSKKEDLAELITLYLPIDARQRAIMVMDGYMTVH